VTTIINFVQHFKDKAYKNILDIFINSITKHLLPSDYIITGKFDKSCLNVTFFIESFFVHKHALIVHGLADKNYRNHPSINNFDYIFVSGELWKQKLISQGVNKNKIYITGFVKLDPLFNDEYTKNKYDKPVILYAPSHTNCPSLQGKFEQYLDILSTKYHVLNSVHPYNKEDKKPTMQSLVDADVVISDCSSIIYESLSLGKPVVFADWLIKDEILNIYSNSFEEYIYKNNIGYHAKNFKEFIKQIDYALINGIDQKTEIFIEGIFPKCLRGNSGKTTAQILMELMECKNIS
jgi:CDP-glycerol glycerophosphotransferase (TagB/SpsB family)